MSEFVDFLIQKLVNNWKPYLEIIKVRDMNWVFNGKTKESLKSFKAQDKINETYSKNFINWSKEIGSISNDLDSQSFDDIQNYSIEYVEPTLVKSKSQFNSKNSINLIQASKYETILISKIDSRDSKALKIWDRIIELPIPNSITLIGDYLFVIRNKNSVSSDLIWRLSFNSSFLEWSKVFDTWIQRYGTQSSTFEIHQYENVFSFKELDPVSIRK